MARKDDIIKTFLSHDLLKSKYKISNNEIPSSVKEGLNSDKTIIKAIAIIIESLESNNKVTDNTLRNTINQFLNDSKL